MRYAVVQEEHTVDTFWRSQNAHAAASSIGRNASTAKVVRRGPAGPVLSAVYPAEHLEAVRSDWRTTGLRRRYLGLTSWCLGLAFLVYVFAYLTIINLDCADVPRSYPVVAAAILPEPATETCIYDLAGSGSTGELEVGFDWAEPVIYLLVLGAICFAVIGLVRTRPR